MLLNAAVNSFGDMVHLFWCWSCCFLYVGGLSSSCWCRFPSSIPFSWSEVSTAWVYTESKVSRSRRMRCRVRYYILSTSPSVGIRRECGMSLSFWIQLALVTGFRRVSSLAFSLVLSWVLYKRLIVDISVCNSWGLSYFPSWRLSSSSTLWVFAFLISI